MKTVVEELSEKGYEAEFIDEMKKNGTVKKLETAVQNGQKEKAEKIREQIQQWYDEFVYFGFFDEIIMETY